MAIQRKYILPLFLLFQIILVKALAFFPQFVEFVYSNGFYQYVSKFERLVLGNIPFSVGDILYGILIIYLMAILWKTRKSWRLHWKDHLLRISGVLSVVYFLFHLLWGLNYYREPLFEKMAIQKEYTTADLVAFTEKLIVKTNAVQLQLTKNKNLKISPPYSQDTIFALSQKGYDALSRQYPFFAYKTGSRKKSLFSLPLTYMGFGGYLNPFTNEAQVNNKLPMYGFPNVVCHEMAHQIGYASESECNFIGFLAGIKNDDLYFQYSAYSGALRYCLNNIALKDEKLFEKLKSKIHPGILKNYKESEQFWEQYDTFIDKGFHIFYDQFLKMNQQEEGIESYSKFVDLLINYYKQEAF